MRKLILFLIFISTSSSAASFRFFFDDILSQSSTSATLVSRLAYWRLRDSLGYIPYSAISAPLPFDSEVRLSRITVIQPPTDSNGCINAPAIDVVVGAIPVFQAGLYFNISQRDSCTVLRDLTRIDAYSQQVPGPTYLLPQEFQFSNDFANQNINGRWIATDPYQTINWARMPSTVSLSCPPIVDMGTLQTKQISCLASDSLSRTLSHSWSAPSTGTANTYNLAGYPALFYTNNNDGLFQTTVTLTVSNGVESTSAQIVLMRVGMPEITSILPNNILIHESSTQNYALSTRYTESITSNTPPYLDISASIDALTIRAHSVSNRTTDTIVLNLNGNGLTNTTNLTVIINNRPNISIEDNAVNNLLIEGQYYSAQNVSTDTDGFLNENLSYVRINGQEHTEPTLLSAGDYLVQAEATDNDGALSIATKSISVSAFPNHIATGTLYVLENSVFGSVSINTQTPNTEHALQWRFFDALGALEFDNPNSPLTNFRAVRTGAFSTPTIAYNITYGGVSNSSRVETIIYHARAQSCSIPTQTSASYSLDSAQCNTYPQHLRQMCYAYLDTQCSSAHPQPLDNRITRCTQLPIMRSPYYIDAQGAPQENTADMARFGILSFSDYVEKYNDEDHLATRCKDHSYKERTIGGLSVFIPPPRDANVSNTHACWDWDVRYVCETPLYSNCSLNINQDNAAFNDSTWTELGRTNVFVDNLTFNALNSERRATLSADIHLKRSERWLMQCINEDNGVRNIRVEEAFCQKTDAGEVISQTCAPAPLGNGFSEGVRFINAANAPVARAIIEAQSTLDSTLCNYSYELPIIANINTTTLVSKTTQQLRECAVTIGDTPVVGISDRIDGVDCLGDDTDCWSVKTRLEAYTQEQERTCASATCSNLEAVQIVDCLDYDYNKSPVNEWGEYAYCIQPVWEMYCPTTNTETISGDQCVEQITTQQFSFDGEEVIHQEGYRRCANAPENCNSEARCTLIESNPSTDTLTGLISGVSQRYACQSVVQTCDSTITTTTCSDDIPDETALNNAAQALSDVQRTERIKLSGSGTSFFGADRKTCVELTALANHAARTASASAFMVSAAIFGPSVGSFVTNSNALALISSYANSGDNCCSNSEGLFNQEITSLFGSIPIGACSRQERELMQSRNRGRGDGGIFSRNINGWHLEGAGVKLKPRGSGYYGNEAALALQRKQDWCAFNSALDATIHTNAREQLRQIAISAPTITTSNINIARFGNGWQMVSTLTRNVRIAFYQFNETCKQTPQAHCPYSENDATIALCTIADCGQLQSLGSNTLWKEVPLQSRDNQVLGGDVLASGVCTNSTCTYQFRQIPPLATVHSIQVSIPNTTTYSVTGVSFLSTAIADVCCSTQSLVIQTGLDNNGSPIYTTMSVSTTHKHVVLNLRLQEDLSTDRQLVVPLDSAFTTQVDSVSLSGRCNEYACDFEIIRNASISPIADNSCRGLSEDELSVLDFTKMQGIEDAVQRDINVDDLDDDILLFLQNTLGVNTSGTTSERQNGGWVVLDTGNYTHSGQLFTLKVGAYLDANTRIARVVSVDWGDGSTPTLNTTKRTSVNLWEAFAQEKQDEFEGQCTTAFQNYQTIKADALQDALQARLAYENACVSSNVVGCANLYNARLETQGIWEDLAYEEVSPIDLVTVSGQQGISANVAYQTCDQVAQSAINERDRRVNAFVNRIANNDDSIHIEHLYLNTQNEDYLLQVVIETLDGRRVLIEKVIGVFIANPQIKDIYQSERISNIN